MGLESPDYDDEPPPSSAEEVADVVGELNTLLAAKQFNPDDTLEQEGAFATIDVWQIENGSWYCSLAPIFTARPPFRMCEGVIELLQWSAHDARGTVIANGVVGDETRFTFDVPPEAYPFTLRFDWPSEAKM